MTHRVDARYVGACSGTSVDGLDVALLEISESRVTIVDGTTFAFDPSLRRQLLSLGASEVDDVDSLGAADTLLGRFIGHSVSEFLESRGLTPQAIHAIGSHGQTVRHRPRSEPPYTLQIGDPNVIAEITGITTVADFRRRDVAAGGEGAPLVPLFHAALFAPTPQPRTVLNIGGIANITTLPRDDALCTVGFDTGPGNTLLDAWTRSNRQTSFDHDGAWASSGKVDDELLDEMLGHPYLATAPPKSTGRETFSLEWLHRKITSRGMILAPADVQATLAELTARTVADGLTRWGHPSGDVIVAGGGRLNLDLMGRLRRLLPSHSVAASESHGVNGDCLEAAAFAWLAHRTMAGLTGNVPAVTGASGARVLGAIYSGNSRAG
jgi:anhydro-N-acetylmuramic acid kinase